MPPRRSRLACVLSLLGLLVVAPCFAQPVDAGPVPPRRREAVRPAPDGNRYVWQRGSWDWNEATRSYAWHPGRHVVRRPFVTRFVPGRWARSSGDWVWIKARWR